MSTVYEKSYGAVKFYETDGTLIFDTESDLDLWTSEDTEPSPEPKWVRVDVPGADGAVDLSRALAGQVTYETREIHLRFAGSRADHATALALVRTMRRALHGARVHVETVLTGLVGGYYVADCECDGTAWHNGAVTIDVTAWADPFIHVGTQTLALPASTETTSAAAYTQELNSDIVAGAGRFTTTLYIDSAEPVPILRNISTGRLWYACGDTAASTNLLDLSRYHAVRYDSDGDGTYVYDADVSLSDHVVDMGECDYTEYPYKEVYVLSSERTGSFSGDGMGDIPFFGSPTGNVYIGVYLTGTVTAVGSSPLIVVTLYSVNETDGHGRPTNYHSYSGVPTTVKSITASTFSGELVSYYKADFVNTSVIRIYAYNMSYTDLSVALVMTTDPDGLPSTWTEPSIGYVDVDFGGTFCKALNVTDEAVISPLGVTTTHYATPDATGRYGKVLDTPYTTTGSISGWLPEDAKYVCTTLTNTYGEDYASGVYTAMDSYSIETATGSNTTMRSTPTVTSTGGALVTIGDRTAIVSSGTVTLDALTIPGGDFTVDYATLDAAAATLTWEGGVL